MDTATIDTRALTEGTIFLGYFNGMPDPRQAGKISYRLDEILLLCLMAVLAGAEGFTDIACFGKKKLALLRQFLPYEHGTPSHDHLGDIFAVLDAGAFRRCFIAWVSSFTQTPAELIAIDGKTSRRSGSRGKDMLHTVSAFAASQHLVLGQMKVEGKSNEILVIPALLDMLCLEGALVTIDAMGCQRVIAQKITSKKADYLLALKGNQGTLHEDVDLFVREQKERGFVDTTATHHDEVTGDHGRIETRRVSVIHDVGWLQERHNWPCLKGVVAVESRREAGGQITEETRLYLTSSPLEAKALAPMVRGHWEIENCLHWVMDMVFKDDHCRVRTLNAPENFMVVKHMAANLARRKKGKYSMRLTLKAAGWDDDTLLNLVTA